MLNEKEVTIVKALIEEEMGYLKCSDNDDARVFNTYFTTLANIVSKLQYCTEDARAYSDNIPASI